MKQVLLLGAAVVVLLGAWLILGRSGTSDNTLIRARTSSLRLVSWVEVAESE